MPHRKHPPAEPEATTRDRILAAALDVFAERGFDGARVRDIAERADANLGLLTYYFSDKQQLWQAAVGSAFAELAAELGQVLAEEGGDDLADLERIVRQFVRFVARRPAFMRLMNDEGKRDSARMRWLADTHVRPLSGAIRQRIQGAQKRGALPPIAPVHLYYIVLGAAGLIFSQGPECRRIADVDPTDPDFAEAHADAIVRLVINAGGPRRTKKR
jgi:TetR/AcrR family transcriptional regulator